MFMVVVIIFAVCWLPYHVYFIYTYHDTEIRRQPYIQHVYLGFYWLAMSNSMFNPLIYYWMNARWGGPNNYFPLNLQGVSSGRSMILWTYICIFCNDTKLPSRFSQE